MIVISSTGEGGRPMSALKNRRRVLPADIVRRLLLAWLAAAAIEYLLLPVALRDLNGLEGLARMSLLRAAAVTGGGAALLVIEKAG